jgi:hypothetical protein
MNNTDDMKLIKEFYEDYRLKEEYKKPEMMNSVRS